ncbi:S8 family peptidase [Mucilaginibacter sp.]|uniref:S8 family peptidase n=1 Tax=Mucilaginibacter sp. TaxID=1882438 RepID=UPI0025EB2803|nr:S8 family peptidase [Mucilaginibacter sp.]
MIINPGLIESLIFKRFQQTLRFTQDSPIFPDVWLAYFEQRGDLKQDRVDLILSPHKNSSASQLFTALSHNLLRQEKPEETSGWQLATSGESVVACLTFEELILVALPMTQWWQTYLFKNKEPTEDYYWLIRLIGAIVLSANTNQTQSDNPAEILEEFEHAFHTYFDEFKPFKIKAPVTLWAINRNRRATLTIERSVPATKADAGRRLFEIDGSGIAWAVLDSGIDARHPAFRKTDTTTKKPFDDALGDKTDKFSNHTRIVASYDFTRFRKVLASIHKQYAFDKPRHIPSAIKSSGDSDDAGLSDSELMDFVKEIDNDLRNGRLLDWSVIAPLLRIPHNIQEYYPPVHPHGTHVAGIIGAGIKDEVTMQNVIGMCPGIDLYDLRVMDDSGSGEEFNILAGIQFIRWMNNQKDEPAIHGVNMSFSMVHEVASYACGQTPVCICCEKLVNEGTVIVAAAGNLGQALFTSTDSSTSAGFRMVNITDPGNAELVITVGATHRNRPHDYGVSYFSSKGPTGDGRLKPDLVAPGEKIVSTSIDNSMERMDGTSMAAPHVSGAAALILARHRELIGKPGKVKQALCKTATDLGREKYFQGCGMLDVLRAIQSI